MSSPNEINADIVSTLGPDGVLAAYEACGVKISGKPGSNGWVSAHAVGRADKTPSARINVNTGWYRSWGDNAESISLFDFLVRYGRDDSGARFTDWKDARKFLAKKTGLSRRLPRKEDRDDRPADRFKFTSQADTANPIFMGGLLRRYPQITHEAILECGGRLANYPPKGPSSMPVCVFPVFGPQLEAPPRAFVALPANGKKIMLYRGGDSPPEPRDKLVFGGTGLVGLHGLNKLRDAELVYKVEGISDMLALQAFIPQAYRDKHVVITNACGASETSLPSEVAPVFLDSNVVLIHDCDRPGQDGVLLWIGALNGIAGSVKNLVLPYSIEEKHGKDLRDWIGEGHSYDELLAMVTATPAESVTRPSSGAAGSPSPTTTPSRGLTENQKILKNLAISVIGEMEDNTIVAFSQHLGKHVRIKGLRSYSYADAIQNFGEANEAFILPPGAEVDSSKITMEQLRRALAAEAGKRRIIDDRLLGRGVWYLNGRLVLVNSGYWTFANGKLAMSKEPNFGDAPIDFTSGSPWFDFDRLNRLYDLAVDPKWCEAVFDEAVALFSRWNNWKQSMSPELVASLVACSWIQACWDLRPLVYVIGPTNCGKSVLVKAIAEMFGSLRLDTDQPSAAGIRQSIRHTAQILIVDEFERCDERSKIMSMLRSSSRGAMIVKGTANQRAINFTMKHIVWLSSIESGMREAADENRYIMLELGGMPRGAPRTLVVPPTNDLQELGMKLLAVALRKFHQANPLAVRLGKMGFAGVESRVVEIYSVPVAMIASIRGWDDAQCIAYMDQVFGAQNLQYSFEDDEHDLIQQIFEASVQIARGRASIGQLLEWPNHDRRLGDDDPKDILERHGIKEMEIGGKAGLFFAPKLIRKLLQTEQNVGQILGRCQGAIKSVREYLNKIRTRGVFVPLEAIETIGLGSAHPEVEETDGASSHEITPAADTDSVFY